MSYIDPQVTAETRTAKVRVDVPNPRGDLRLGMYVDVVITGTSAGATLLISRRAVQHVGDRTVVYVADPAQSARFVEREVGVRAASEDRVEVTSGIHDGDRVVTEGSFFIRAERERLGLRP